MKSKEWKQVRRKPIILQAYQTDIVEKINTLEGVMQASPGDWIVQGLQGERWPVKPDIFEQTYEILHY
jgi:hypothetical protein